MIFHLSVTWSSNSRCCSSAAIFNSRWVFCVFSAVCCLSSSVILFELFFIVSSYLSIVPLTCFTDFMTAASSRIAILFTSLVMLAKSFFISVSYLLILSSGGSSSSFSCYTLTRGTLLPVERRVVYYWSSCIQLFHAPLYHINSM